MDKLVYLPTFTDLIESIKDSTLLYRIDTNWEDTVKNILDMDLPPLEYELKESGSLSNLKTIRVRPSQEFTIWAKALERMKRPFNNAYAIDFYEVSFYNFSSNNVSIFSIMSDIDYRLSEYDTIISIIRKNIIRDLKDPFSLTVSDSLRLYYETEVDSIV